MSVRLTSGFLRKSRQALRTADLVLASGDTNAAVNRAFNAMETAVMAALSHIGVPEDRLRVTHGGLKTLMYDKLVKPGTIDREIAGLLSKVETLRIAADYRGDDVDTDTAATIVRDARTFVTTMEEQLHLDAVPGSDAKNETDPD